MIYLDLLAVTLIFAKLLGCTISWWIVAIPTVLIALRTIKEISHIKARNG